MHRALVNLLTSKARSMAVARLALLLSLCLLSAVRLRLIVQSWSVDYIHLRDSVQYYLIGKALLAGEYLYTPMNELVLKFAGANWYSRHPAPYPPSMALLCAPLGRLDLLTVPRVWFVLSLAALIATVCMLVHWYRGKLDLPAILLLLVLVIGWYPVWIDLVQGQVSILLLALLTGAWLLLRKGQDVAAGLLLGLSLSIKLVAWPLLLYFLIKRQWRLLIAAGALTLLLHLAAALVTGIQPVLDYYFRVTGEVLPYYQAHWYNVSLWTLGWRLFAGTGSTMLDVPTAPPLVSLPSLAPVVSGVVVAGMLVLGLSWALRLKQRDTALAMVIYTSLLVSPISWIHYYSMALIGLVIGIRYLKQNNYPPNLNVAYAGLVLALFLSTDWIQGLVRSPSILSGPQAAAVSFSVSMLNLLPAAALLGLMVLLRRLDRLSPPPAG